MTAIKLTAIKRAIVYASLGAAGVGTLAGAGVYLGLLVAQAIILGGVHCG